MKRMIVICLLLALLLACVPTPEEEFVVNKSDQSAMIESSRSEDAQAVTDLRTAYHIPERMTAELTSPDGVTHVTVDAEIVVPDGPLPIVRVYAAEFEQPIVTALWNTLVGDNVLYNQWEDEETKADIERDLKQYSEQLSQIQSGELDENDAMYSVDELTEMIAELQARYASAPDGYEKEIETGILKKQYIPLGDNKRAAARMGISARTEGEPWINFHVENDTDNTEALIYREKDGWSSISLSRSAHMYYNRMSPGAGCTFMLHVDQWVESYAVTPSDPLPQAATGVLSTAPKDAFETVAQFLKETGLDKTLAISRATVLSDRQAPDAPDAQYAYCFELVRTVNGSPCARSGNVRATRLSDDDMTAPYWGIEICELYLDDTGIFSFEWYSPLIVGDTVVGAAKQMHFSEILPIAERMLPLMETQGYDPNVTKSVDRTIDRVELGLWRIVEQNELGNGLLVPVYCFYGTDLHRREFQDGFTAENYFHNAFLIINAVDGSIIDPAKGY